MKFIEHFHTQGWGIPESESLEFHLNNFLITRDEVNLHLNEWSGVVKVRVVDQN